MKAVLILLILILIATLSLNAAPSHKEIEKTLDAMTPTISIIISIIVLLFEVPIAAFTNDCNRFIRFLTTAAGLLFLFIGLEGLRELYQLQYSDNKPIVAYCLLFIICLLAIYIIIVSLFKKRRPMTKEAE